MRNTTSNQAISTHDKKRSLSPATDSNLSSSKLRKKVKAQKVQKVAPTAPPPSSYANVKA